MGIRFSKEMIGTQFHPEADPVGMAHYLKQDEKKEIVISHHGEEKYFEMLEHLYDDDKIKRGDEMQLCAENNEYGLV